MFDFARRQRGGLRGLSLLRDEQYFYFRPFLEFFISLCCPLLALPLGTKIHHVNVPPPRRSPDGPDPPLLAGVQMVLERRSGSAPPRRSPSKPPTPHFQRSLCI